jgi:hypothetical protein
MKRAPESIAKDLSAEMLEIRILKSTCPRKISSNRKRFYLALGFVMSPGWGGTADFELSGHRFRLQDYYVKDWANNFMVVMNVDDVRRMASACTVDC